MPFIPAKNGKEEKIWLLFWRTKDPGKIVHFDLCGKLRKGNHGRKYFCAFIDQHIRFMHDVGLRKKSETAEVFQQYLVLNHVKKYFNIGVKKLYTDGGREYFNVKVDDHKLTGGVKLEEVGLSGKYWQFAVEHASYVKKLNYSLVAVLLFASKIDRQETNSEEYQSFRLCFIRLHGKAGNKISCKSPASHIIINVMKMESTLYSELVTSTF